MWLGAENVEVIIGRWRARSTHGKLALGSTRTPSIGRMTRPLPSTGIDDAGWFSGTRDPRTSSDMWQQCSSRYQVSQISTTRRFAHVRAPEPDASTFRGDIQTVPVAADGNGSCIRAHTADSRQFSIRILLISECHLSEATANGYRTALCVQQTQADPARTGWPSLALPLLWATRCMGRGPKAVPDNAQSGAALRRRA